MEGMRAPFQGHLNVLIAIPMRMYKHKQHGPDLRVYTYADSRSNQIVKSGG